MASSSTALPISGLVAYIKSLGDASKAGAARGLLAATELAYKAAVSRAKSQFNNTPGRVRTGQLTTSIYKGFNPETLEAFIASRLVYARMMELGGEVVPKSAQHLWVKNHVGIDSRFKRWGPRDFMTAREQARTVVGRRRGSARRDRFFFMHEPHTGRLLAMYQAGGAGPAQTQLLFSLVDRVRIPGRPYMAPAVEEAVRALPKLIQQFTAQEAKK